MAVVATKIMEGTITTVVMRTTEATITTMEEDMMLDMELDGVRDRRKEKLLTELNPLLLFPLDKSLPSRSLLPLITLNFNQLLTRCIIILSVQNFLRFIFENALQVKMLNKYL